MTDILAIAEECAVQATPTDDKAMISMREYVLIEFANRMIAIGREQGLEDAAHTAELFKRYEGNMASRIYEEIRQLKKGTE